MRSLNILVLTPLSLVSSQASSFGLGTVPADVLHFFSLKAATARTTPAALHEVFAELDKSGSGYMDVNGLNAASIKLGFPFRNNAELKEKFAEIDTNGKGRISELEFVEWWNKATPASKRLQKQLSLTAAGEVALEKTLFAEDKEKK